MFDSFVSGLLWAHLTIFLALIYHHLWRSYILSNKSNINEHEDESEAESKSEEESESEAEDQSKNEEKNESVTPEGLRPYLDLLGKKDFGKELMLDFTVKNVNKLDFIDDATIELIDPVHLHKYLMKLILSNDHFIFKMGLSGKLNYKIKGEESDKPSMVKFITEIRNTAQGLENKNNVDSTSSMMVGLIPMISQITTMMSGPPVDERIFQAEEITELEREMQMTTKS